MAANNWNQLNTYGGKQNGQYYPQQIQNGFRNPNQGSVFGEYGDMLGEIGGAALTAYNVWNSYQATKLAKEEMAFAKEQYYTNMRNSISSYNTNLQDKINGRHSSAERTQEQKDADYNNKKLQEV